jgi:hypothetical protein
MKNTSGKIKKESSTDMLARLMVQGFERITGDFKQGQEELRQEFRQGFEELRDEFRTEFSAVKEEQKETNRHMAFMERKQEGTRISMDETVHKSEFIKLERRVEILEHK